MKTFIEGLEFKPGELITIGSRPAMGKSCLGIQFAQEAATQGANILILSLEGKADRIMKRIVAQRAEVEIDRFDFPLPVTLDQREKLTGKEVQRIVQEINTIDQEKKQITICDFRDWRNRFENWEGFYKKAIEEERNKYIKFDFILIDYVQLINTCNPQGNRHIELESILISIKHMAMELDITIVLLSQLSRKVEERQAHRPMITDLRESGTIEEVSDKILLLLRRDYYDPLDKPGCAELILAKDRQGKLNNFPLCFRREIQTFANRVSIR